MKISESVQLQELIDFYRAQLLPPYAYHCPYDPYRQFFENMTQTLAYCQQCFVLQCRILPFAAENQPDFSWFITFVFFRAAFACNEQLLYQLLREKAPDNTLDASSRTLGRACRALTGQFAIKPAYHRSFDLLDAMKAMLDRQHTRMRENSSEALTTYHDQPVISTYGYKVDLISPSLLFTILKDIGKLFSVRLPESASPAACSLAGKQKTFIC